MRHRFEFLDGLRGIAAAAVVYLHTLATFEVDLPTPNAGLAVDFFFCLSGFVIAHAYDRRLAEGMSWKAFMAARVRRLYPILVLGVVLGAIAAVFAKQPLIWIAGYALFGLLMVPEVLTGALAYPINFPMWSLAFEFLANGAYGAERGRLSVVALAGMVLAFGIALACLVYLAGQIDGLGLGGKSFVAGIPRVFYPFTLGVLIYRTRLWTRLPPLPAVIVALLLALLLLATLDHWLYDAAAGLIGPPVLVVFGAAVATDGALGALWRWLGALSYPLYLVHVPALVVAHETGAGPVLGFTLAVVIGWLTLVLYDRPVRRALADTARRAAPATR